MDNRNDYVLRGGEVYLKRDDRSGRYRVVKVLAAWPPDVSLVRSYQEDFAAPPPNLHTGQLTPATCGPVRYAAIFADWLAAEDDWIEDVSEEEEQSIGIVVRGTRGS